jgi:phosphoglycolate phosphatase
MRRAALRAKRLCIAKRLQNPRWHSVVDVCWAQYLVRLNILLDLDGTLTDPGAGIVSCLQHALVSLGRPVVPRSELCRFIGPPLYDSLCELLGTNDPALVGEALGFYRERYSSHGLYENEVYPGIKDALKNLRDRGDTLFVATSKPEPFATRIIEHFRLAGYFQRVWGSELDGTRSDKSSLIARILEKEELNPKQTVMVGDRFHDAVGARANGVIPVGVLWGYGDEQELATAQCKVLLRTPADLASLVIA